MTPKVSIHGDSQFTRRPAQFIGVKFLTPFYLFSTPSILYKIT